MALACILIVHFNATVTGYFTMPHKLFTSTLPLGIYLGDLFVRPAFRGKGYGKAMLKKLAAIAKARGCGRLEWCCLDWNRPSIDFYLSLGAVPLDDWTLYRVTGDTLTHLAQG